MAMGLLTKPRYHRRLFAGLVIYSALLVGCFAFFQYMREKQYKADELNARLQIINRLLLDSIIDGNIPAKTVPMLIAGLNDLRVSIIDTTGRVIYDNSIDSLPGSNHLDREEIASAVATGEGYATRRHSSSTGQTYFYSAKAGNGYIVRTAVPYSVSLSQLLSVDYGFLWVTLVITVVMCVLGYVATRRVGVHVERLNGFARRAERGERIYDNEPFPHDELGEISNHIVRLYARLQQAIADRDREHCAAMREQQERELVKRRLTNNINHELKTPVASMQVCLETLSRYPDMNEGKRREFVDRCLRANERLGRLLTDVAALTRMEEGGDNITTEQVDLSRTVAEVCDELGPEAAARNIIIDNAIDYSGPFRANQQLMASVFRNLIANAIAYSGGSWIKLRQTLDGRRLTLTVEDNGQGVGEEHLPRLFERFYRVDKGRSRQAGGTGLGLSIVKNAVRWHGGTVSVANRQGGGLYFTISFDL